MDSASLGGAVNKNINTCSWWKRFRAGISIIGLQPTDKAAVKGDTVGKMANQKTTFIKFKNWGAVVRFCNGVVEANGIGLFIMVDCNSSQGLDFKV